MSQERLPRRHSRFSDRRGLDAWSVLLTFFSLISSAVAAVLEPVKLSNDELLVLTCLAHAGDTLSMGEIQHSSFLQTARVRHAVDKLEARRLVAWRRSRADRRKVLVRITKAGRQLTESISPAMFELVGRVAETLGREDTEFMRAKLRKIVSSAASDAEGASRDPCCDDTTDSEPPPQPGTEPGVHSAQRPPTWGMAGWLRWCQWSGHVDRIWRTKVRNLGLTAPRLQVLAALHGASEGMTVDAIASATGLHQAILTSTLLALEQGGLVTRWGEKTPLGDRLARLTPRGAYQVLEALPMANSLADDLYQGLSDEDLEHVLSLVPKACGAAWQVRHHYGVTQSSTSTTSAQ